MLIFNSSAHFDSLAAELKLFQSVAHRLLFIFGCRSLLLERLELLQLNRNPDAWWVGILYCLQYSQYKSFILCVLHKRPIKKPANVSDCLSKHSVSASFENVRPNRRNSTIWHRFYHAKCLNYWPFSGSVNQYIFVLPEVDQRAGQLSLPHLGITKTEKEN